MKYACVTCEAPFISYQKNPKYCSMPCQVKARTKVDREGLLKLLQAGLTQEAIAERLGVARPTVTLAMRRYGIRKRVVIEG